jgi:Tfp pilus assembly protein FimV
VAPPIKPVTAQADWSITPSPPHQALASRMPLQTGSLETHTTEQASTVDPAGQVKATHVEFPVTTVIVPIVIGLVVMILVILGSSLAWMRMKRSGRSSSSQTGRSSSIDEEKESKVEAVKTISNMTTTSSVDEDEHAISLQHWSSKKAVSNRYESWHIGEIDQEWVSE